MSPLFWFTAGYGSIAVFVLLFFAGVAKANREHDEEKLRRVRLDAEEDRVHDDIRAMRLWYAEQTARKDAEIIEAFLAEL